MKNSRKGLPDVECLKYHGTQAKPDIKIFVSHRIDIDSMTIDNPPYIPVRCGAVYDEREGITTLGDDTGDNISCKRMSYCELTVQYWAWKNIEADYYGLCHYRRYLSGAKKFFVSDVYGNVMCPQLNPSNIEKYGLSNGKIMELVGDCDIVLPTAQDVSKYPEKFDSVWNQFISAKFLHKKDLSILMDIIKEKYPDYYDSAKEYLFGTKAYMCNLFIMSKKYFFEYSQWLFSILDEFCVRADMSNYDTDELRTPGHLAERLLGIFVYHQRKTNPDIQIKELQPIVFLSTEREKKMEENFLLTNVKKAYSENCIAIVLSSSDLYSPYAATVIQSIIDCSSTKYNYDIICFETRMSSENRRRIEEMSTNANISVRVISLGSHSVFENASVNGYFSVETYFRLLLPFCLPDYEKIIWLDSDTLVQTDIAELFALDVKGNLVAATHDYNAMALINGMDSQYSDLCKKELGLSKPEQYFQAGVLVMNLSAFRDSFTESDIISLISNTAYPYADQDILNQVCMNRVYWLDSRWDVVADVENCLSNVIKYWCSEEILSTYQRAKEKPYIIHYAGPTKPWHSPKYYMAERFWTVCRETSFYEIVLLQMISDTQNGILRYGMKPAAKSAERKKETSIFVRVFRCLKDNGIKYTLLRVIAYFKK